MALVAGNIPVSGYQIPDYSGAAAAGGAAAAAPYQMISGLAGQAKDYFKEQGEKKKLVKQSSLQIDAALQLFPDLAPSFQGLKERMKDENIPLADRAAEAEVIANLINMGVGEMRNRASMSIEQQKAQIDAAYKQANLDIAQQRANIYGQKAQAEASKRTKGTLSFFDPETNQSEEMDVNYDAQGRPRRIGTDELIVDPVKVKYGEGGFEKPPETSQYDSSGISNALSMVSAPSVSVGSSIPIVNIPYRGVPAPNRYNNPGGAYPKKDFLKFGLEGKGIIGGGHPIGKYPNIESGIAANMAHFKQMNPVGKTVGQMRHYWTKGKFGGSTPMAGMNENEVITREKLNDPEWMGQWMRSTAQGEGFRGNISDEELASGFKFYQQGGATESIGKQSPSQQITRVGEIIPEIGATPEQQTEIARQIEQFSGMATAQAGGGMPTESSLAQQQPQPPARRQVVATRLISGGQQQQKAVKIVSGEEAQRFGLKPEGTYELSFNPTGELAGVQTVSQPPTETEKAKAEESKIEKEKAASSKDIAIKTISEFVDNKGEATDALKNAVGYGEAFATGVAEYAPFLGTQSGKTRSDQQRLNRLIEGSILDAASLLKPVSNTDLLMLIKNRPRTTDPEETWTTYLREIRSILADPDNYLDSEQTSTQTQPQTATQKLRGKLK